MIKKGKTIFNDVLKIKKTQIRHWFQEKQFKLLQNITSLQLHCY